MWPTEDGHEPSRRARVVRRTSWAAPAAMLLSVCLIALLSANTSHATFPGANGKIVFEKDLVVGGDFNAEIFVMDADGGNPVNLTNNPAHDGAPKWSPDGRRIAFVREADIYVMDADGTNVIRLTNDSYWDFAPAWSADGAQVAFGSNLRPPGGGIFIMQCRDGAIRSLLAGSSFGAFGPDWSPDGTQIAFGEDEILVINQDGTGLRQLTDYGNITAMDASWSPDGSTIAFLGPDALLSNQDVYLMDPDGGNRVNITNSKASEIGVAWSPDGSRIVFSVDHDDYKWDIYTMNPDGKNVDRITDDPDADKYPDWQPLGVAPLPPCAPPASTPATAGLPIGGGPPGTGPGLPPVFALLLFPAAALLMVTGIRLLCTAARRTGSGGRWN